MVFKGLRGFVAAIMLATLFTSTFAYRNTRTASAEVGIPSLPFTHSENFNTLATSGTTNVWTNNVTLVGWDSNRIVYLASNGSSNTGGLYSFGPTTGSTTDRALGSLPSNTSGTIYFGLRLRNNSGSSITSLDVSYVGEQWRDGGNTIGTAQRLNFAYKTGLATTITDIDFTDVDVLDFTNVVTSTSTTAVVLDGNLPANRRSLASTITLASPLASGDEIVLRWEDVNDSGNDHALAVDDFSVTANGGGPVVDNAPTVTGTTPTNNATNVAVNSNIAITFSEPVTVTDGWVSLTTGSPATSVAATITGGPTTFTINPDVDLANSTIYTVTVNADNVTDRDGTPTLMASDYSFSFTTAAAGGVCPVAPTSTIPQVQGSGLTSPAANSIVRVQGVVTADFQATGQLGGFFMQDLNGDGNPVTSDGIFVFHTTTAVNVGDVVSVNGFVSEFRGATQLANKTTDPTFTLTATVCTTAPVPAPVAVDLPVPTLNGQEQYEGMLVAISETLTVDQTYFLGRFGQVTVSADGRVYNPTNRNIPGSPAAIAEAQLNARRMLVVDDGSSTQNRSTIPYLGPDNTLRGGDTLNSLTGVLNQGFVTGGSVITGYIVQPTVTPAFNRVSQRTAAPDAVGGNLKVASFNVLNYFNGNGSGGGFPTSRGAESVYEFNRQRTKIINAMAAINADVVGLMEIENDAEGPLSAIQDLVNGLNQATAPGTYAIVPNPVTPFGSDEIKVALIYKPARVSLSGAAQTLQDPIFDRLPFAQTFQLANGEKFSVIVNHFKSKNCGDATGADADQGDGQGCWNAKRVEQAQTLLNLVNTVKSSSGDNDVLVIGDLNAYGKENPITTLTSAGLVNEVERFLGTTAYSYIFDGGAGYLDHALASASLDQQVTGVTEWHINTDEPVVLDYNVNFKNNPECNQTPCTSPDLYTPTPYASSDHDPVVIGLQLGGDPTPASFAGSIKTVNDTTVQSGDLLTYTLTISNSGQTGATFMLTDTLNANLTFVSASPTMAQNGQQLTVSAAVGPNSQTQYSITVRVNAGFSGVIENSATLSGDGQTRTLTAPAVIVTAAPTAASFAGSSKTVNSNMVQSGDVLTYTLTVSNSGQLPATFTLTDTLDANLTFVSASPTMVRNGQQLTVSGAIGANSFIQYVITARVNDDFTGAINNIATLSGDGQIRTLTAPTVTVEAIPLIKLYLPLILR